MTTEGNGNLLRHSCLGNSIDRAWLGTVHGIAELERLSAHAHMNLNE